MKNSFIENVNILANASTLATGSIVEDVKDALLSAEAAAEIAVNAGVGSKKSEVLSRDWAEKGHNNPVQGSALLNNAEFSSFHWAIESKNSAGDPVINNGVVSDHYTWSSSKLANELSNKSNSSHLHKGIYEPSFGKHTAFNKDFLGSGALDSVARSDHNHDSEYEKTFIHNSAFNKDFGSVSGSVMEGDKNFDNDYMKKEVIKSAYNKSFVLDPLNPKADEVSRGNHIHNAQNVVYDNNYNNGSITSSTVQGGLQYLDEKISSIDFVEKTYLSAGSTTRFDVTITGKDTPANVVMPLSGDSAYKNNASLNNGASINVSYHGAIKRMIQGLYSVDVTLDDTFTDDVSLILSLNNIAIGEGIRVKGKTLSISRFIPLISNNGGVLSFSLVNHTSTDNIPIKSCSIMWEGMPSGAIVSSSTSVDHSNITGTGAPNGVHTISDIKDLTIELNTKADKVSAPIDGNLLIMDSNGNIKDSGVSHLNASNSLQLINPGHLDNIIVQTSTGFAKDGGLKISELALKYGNKNNIFKVAAPQDDDDAVSKHYVHALSSNFVTSVDFELHKNNTNNPHNVTLAQVGGAAALHIHSISEIANLSDELKNKYNLVPASITGNIIAFGSNKDIVDSGIPFDGKLLVGEAV